MTVNKPALSFIPSANFGLPKGTVGRGAQVPVGIVLHTLRHSLDEYAALVLGQEDFSKAHIRHDSVHYAVGYDGATHQYVNATDTALSLDQFDFAHAFNVPPVGNPLWMRMDEMPPGLMIP